MGDVLRNHRSEAEAVLREHGVRFAYENHPERTPQEVLELIGDAEDVLGAAVDTGWWATQGYDPVAGDPRSPGPALPRPPQGRRGAGHRTTPACTAKASREIAACVDELLELGYLGPLSIEHEPYDRDPLDECIRMRELIETRLAATGVGDRG